MKAQLEAAIAVHQKGMFAQAEVQYRDVITSHPDYVHTYYLLAVLYFQSGQWLCALPYVEMAIQKSDQTVASYWCLQGHVLGKLKRYDPAYESYAKALLLDGELTEAKVNQALLLIEMKRFAQAEALVRSCLEREAQNPMLQATLGWALLGQGKADLANAAFSAATATDPYHYEGWKGLAQLARLAGDWERAEQCLYKAFERNQHEPEAHVLLGEVFFKLGKVEWATGAFRSALNLNYAYADAHAGLARVFTAQGNVQAALAHWKQAFYCAESFSPYLVDMAWASLAAGDKDWARGVLAQLDSDVSQDPAPWHELRAALD